MRRRDLPDEAAKALEEGDIERALDLYQRLEITFHDEPSWSRQVASLHGRLGNDRASLEALLRAAERCAGRQEPLKAIAACKLIQAIDPENARARALIDNLLGLRAPAAGVVAMPDLISDLTLPLPRGRSQRGALHLLGEAAPIRDIPLFSLLGRESVEQVLAEARLFRPRRGQTIFSQGDRGDSLFVIVEGGVSVFLEQNPRFHLADLEEGAVFGEIALLADRPRGATVECSVDSELLEISRAVLLDALKGEPSAEGVLFAFLRERLVDTVVKTGPLFRQLETDEQRASLAARFTLLDAGEGAVLIRQGETAPGLYVLVDGSVEITRETEFDELTVAVLQPGHLLGEISTLTRRPAVASVTTMEPSLLLFLSTERIAEAVRQHPELLAYATQLADARIGQIAALEDGDQPRIHLF